MPKISDSNAKINDSNAECNDIISDKDQKMTDLKSGFPGSLSVVFGRRKFT